ncbi:nitrite reductase large subunit NirB [Alcanivorax sp. S6407]|uniref:nitrite reductase large subunit NirB n=1 Tax=Alcanivorax sp. S6407 TaxID=2926424 RepID=UPI001FF16E56|nr:nitrite reductase large subunit NirB [Alcanivorax sp. S6407]MCK0155401.1 nitrite reductase large subunit NirB [Alcanivorax sp. S6407]
MAKQQLLLIGHGMVGQRYLEALVAQGGREQFDITVLCEEPLPAYDRVGLTSYFSGKTADDLSLVPQGFFAEHDIALKLKTRADSIDRAAKTVTTNTGETLAYDKLVLATGSYPFVPPIPGNDRDNCFVYRTIDDLDAMIAASKGGKVGTVVGGGLLGLEAAKALHDLGLETHVVEFAPRLMAVQVDDFGGALLKDKIQELGVTVHTSTGTQEIVDGESCKHRMVFGEDKHLETDLIVFSAGIRPQDALGRACELELGERGGIVVNDHCVTSDEDVYAIGEVALWNGRIFGLVAPGYQMAEVAAEHLMGKADNAFQGADMSTKLKLMGVDVASIGDAHGNTPGCRSTVFMDQTAGIYKKAVISECGKKLLGAVLVGDAADYGNLLQLCLNEMDLPGDPAALVAPVSDGAPLLGADALPDTAQICSCNNVSKGDLCAAIDDGAMTVGDLKTCTKASATCGGCAALVKQVLDSELEKRGVEVNNHLCEHFAFSREEIYHLVRVGEIKTFDELLEKHGRGDGCDICKPTVGSVLASCWNDYVLEKPHAGLQDTNDYFLGNMQRDGTYSIVPRVAGGEITPDKLIVLGEVAKKYDLYTKITGGQRVDLFGARVDQLPEIWKILVDAGFETGHAYGKSVRTVKSCVGSTWCRYGVQDSVGTAIQIEERYKGLRSPHKLKFAVSGCTRECAEAQSKDVGVIATEKGWNLYVCGNGGMRPRHADLFASDLSDEELIKYTDRFLMFYIKTADRLQRTSVWMENLEGGLDYLKDVIINDSLGIGEELEAQMQHVIGTYQCEWKTTIEDEEAVKRFKHFVNDDATDDNLKYVRERGQRRPAYEHERIELVEEA